MPQAPARVIEDGRVTIPAHIRREIEVEKGDYVIVDVQPLEEGEADA